MRVELPRLHAELESVLNAAFRAANVASLARERAGRGVGGGDARVRDAAPWTPPPADVQHAEGVGAAIARSLAGVIGEVPGDSPKKAADGR